jgi:transposase
VIFHATAGTPYRRRGNVNRIKMIKRQMYGRAGFTLLRKRVLLAA